MKGTTKKKIPQKTEAEARFTVRVTIKGTYTYIMYVHMYVRSMYKYNNTRGGGFVGFFWWRGLGGKEKIANRL